MTKPQKNSGTLDQLRGLIRRHAESQAEVQHHPISVTAVTAMPASAPTPTTPPTQQAIVHERFTVRLIGVELARLGEIVLKTHQSTGQRITPTDVLRVGLGRVGDKVPITVAEISALRATDARRNRPLKAGVM